MNKKAILFLSIVSSLLFPVMAYAELYSCDGVWTNQPCDGEIESTLQETPPRQASEESRALSQIETLLHNLRMKSIEARSSFGVDVEIEDVVSRCYSLQTSPAEQLDDCRQLVGTREAVIRELVQQEELLRIRRAELEEKRREPSREVVTAIDRERHIYVPVNPRDFHRKRGKRDPADRGRSKKDRGVAPEQTTKSRFDQRMDERMNRFDQRQNQRQRRR